MAGLWFPRLVSEGMVLQRGKQSGIKGHSVSNDPITVTFCGEVYEIKADEQGDFRVQFNELKPGGPYTLDFKSKTYGLTRFNQVYIGDVYLASGQSNMELPISRVSWFEQMDWSKFNNNQLRYFKVENHPVFTGPIGDLESGEWTAFNENTIQSVSAIGVFLLESLYQSLTIPLGIIQVAIGGTPVQAWLSKDMILPEDLPLLEIYKESAVRQARIEADSQMEQAWHQALNQKDIGWQNKWYQGVHTEDWQTIDIPGDFNTIVGDGFAGALWFSKVFTIDKPMIGKDWLLILGTIVDADEVYINGEKVGQTEYRYPPRRYTVPSGVLRQGENQLILRVKCFNGLGRMTKDKSYLIENDSCQIDLSGIWQYHLGATMPYKGEPEFFHYKPTVLYNGMLAPCFDYNVAGVLWYQGESNTRKPQTYELYLTKLIESFRAGFKNSDLPVVVVQLANFSIDLEADSGWPEIREAQRRVALKEAVGLIVTIDVGEYNDLHPLNKRAIAKRIEAYLLKGQQSPAVKTDGIEATPDELICTFEFFGEGAGFVDQVEVTGLIGIDSLGNGMPLKAAIERGFLRIERPEGHHRIIEIAYHYENDPSTSIIYDINGMPLGPFKVEIPNSYKA